ncbi:RNA polymerase sigma-70 factor (ECF subfamily) [Catenuloplanes nepalensis]|uniref:RNA polymerase sigma-70 factor (ECF subfamily) n=1 Tax=Catenuloplanes nepalensis TaxID=587533 RepID=A0ABT9MPW7_9ACTN|nr:RNA polymerase sigma factor SigJ [Catenuloplanes nepalensis]MDP9793462.1 RNA polymerase sigma-70 factor (ECF subfamily) [Catenuloplanes nepalensis]
MPPDPLTAFLGTRDRLFGIGYRMLGSVAEAEDLVQETWMRWQRTDHRTVRDPAAYLVTTITRLAINEATSARARRETYPGPWLPEPVATGPDPALGAERAEALELAVLVLLERLGARERAAYVLREAFDYPYRRIAEILEVSEPNARQLVTRARAHLAEHRRAPADAATHRRLLDAFLAAARDGDVGRLEAVLTADAVYSADGGGVVSATLRPVSRRIPDFVAGIAGKLNAVAGVTWSVVTANGGPALLVTAPSGPLVLMTVEVTDDRIHRIHAVRNPSKLRAFA